MPSVREKIISLHGETSLRRSALRIGNGAGAFEWAMKGRGYRVALEIGTYRGASAAAMAEFCDQVITIDLQHGQAEGFDRFAFWRSLGVDNVDLRLVANNAEKAELIAGLDFDFAFVDGAHDETVVLDFGMVRKCGRVLFHDYSPHPGHVFRLVNSLPREEVETRDIFALWTASYG